MVKPMAKPISFLKSYSNWRATLDSKLPMDKKRNIIDGNVDNDPDEKTDQLAWARSGFQKSSFTRTL